MTIDERRIDTAKLPPSKRKMSVAGVVGVLLGIGIAIAFSLRVFR